MKNIDRIVPNYKLIDWEFPEIFQKIQEEMDISRELMLETFNCGYGMVAIVTPDMVSRMPKKMDIIGEVT